MALVYKDRVQETTTTTGTGSYTLAGAVAGYQAFSAIGDGNTCYYTVTDGTNWEVGVGTYTLATTTLARTTILSSSNAGSAVSWGSGSKNVFLDFPASAAGNAYSGSSVTTIQNKTAAYTVVTSDNGTIINCTSGTFTVTLTSATTLGAGFNCWIWNASNTATDAITVQPASGTIDGLSTLVLRRGDGVQIVCDGANWQTSSKKVMRGYSDNVGNSDARAIASGNRSIAVGGYNTLATGAGASSFGYAANAGANFSFAAACNSGGSGSVTVTGAGATALGGSYASGTDSFAAATTNNTSSYGALGNGSISVGNLAKASAAQSISLGYGALASGTNSVCLSGANCTASAAYSLAAGAYSVAAITGKFTFASGRFTNAGDAQSYELVFRANTTGTTATALTSDQAAASATNQVVLQANSATVAQVLVIARDTVSADAKSWLVTAMATRGATASATAIVGTPSVTVIGNTSGAASWSVAVAADTTNGAMQFNVTGAGTNAIHTVAAVWGVETV